MRIERWYYVAAVLLLLLLLPACAGSATRGPGLDRVDLGGKTTPDFALLDQWGNNVRLSQLQGKAVALTFLYSSCPDVCPVVTQTFGEAYDRLGKDRNRVVFAAVSVDPERDSGEQVRRYLEAQKLQDKMLYLTGDRPALEAVWAAYHIGVIKMPPATTTAGAAGFYYVDHHNRVYLIDSSGRQRVLLKDFKFTAEQLVDQLRPFLGEAK